MRPDGDARDVRVSTVHLPEHGADTLLVVCHDLTDFKFRIEAQKDRKVAARLQHEEKNAHQAQELDAERAARLLAELEAKLRAQRDIAHEYHPDWVDFYSAHADSCRSLATADGVLRDMAARAREAQHATHRRVMLRQLARDEYVPARTPVDLVACLQAQLGKASDVAVHAGEALPELLVDWNLLWCVGGRARRVTRHARSPPPVRTLAAARVSPAAHTACAAPCSRRVAGTR